MKKEIFNPLKKYLDEVDKVLFPNFQAKEIENDKERTSEKKVNDDLFSLVKKLKTKNKRLVS